MTTLDNFVAVDWRAGKDQIFFIFKNTNTYSRFDVAQNRVIEGYPKEITRENWGDFHLHARNLRFGFSTTGFLPTPQFFGFESDILWLFYHDGTQPMVCKYDQDIDEVDSLLRLEESPWRALMPYFDRIVAGTWRYTTLRRRTFEFLLNDGQHITLDLQNIHKPVITKRSWPDLSPYTHRIITAAQDDGTLTHSVYYIFLDNNQYIKYNLLTVRMISGPRPIDEGSWPQLLTNDA